MENRSEPESWADLMRRIEKSEIEKKLRRLDYSLLELIDAHQETIGSKGTGKLVKMQRDIRKLRFGLG